MYFKFSEVKEYFAANGCVLLAKEYKNVETKMPYICQCGRYSEISFKKFKIGQRCFDCKIEKLRKYKKYTIEDVKGIFQLSGYKLLEENYKDNRFSMRCICINGHEFKISLNHFLKGHRCSCCYGNKKHSFNYVKNFFADNNCVLLENYYSNSRCPLSYICSCGNVSKINFSDFINGKRCYNCGLAKISKSRRLNFDYVKKLFEDNNCILLADKYDGAHKKMPYICKCGNKSEINYCNFKNGVRCGKCSESKGESKINEVLKSTNLKFTRQVKLNECKYKKNLLFDFMVEKNGFKLLIEYNGMQHYKPVKWDKTMTQEKSESIYEEVKIRDKIKQKWAEKEKIPLLIIPYWEFKNIEKLINEFTND